MAKKLIFILIAALSVHLYAGKRITVPGDARTIKAGLEKAEAGDTVFVKKGTYHERITLKDEVVLLGESTAETIIRGKSSRPVVIGADKAVIKNFTIKDGEKGILCANNYMTIEHNLICNNLGSGIHCLVTLPIIRNNIVYQNRWSGIYCETVRGIHGRIENNLLMENSNSGIMLAGKSEVLVQNNVFLHNKQYGIWVNEGARRSRIIYNDFYMNRDVANHFAIIDRTDFGADPQYDFDASPAEIFVKPSVPLQQRGKDNKDIGILAE